MAHTAFPVKESDILQSETTRYLITDFSGEGAFSKVAKCLNLTTNEMVAIKILKVNTEQAIKSEIRILQALMSLDPDKSNIVRFIESFKHLHLHCVVFEMLDRDLWDLVDERRRKRKTFTLNEIRPLIHQLMTAFDALGRQGIIHTDLKSDNIMLVNQSHHPYKIKLIDFGLAFPETAAVLGMPIQSCPFRAPEVFLGAPLTTAVDMWGLGCVMAHLYFGAVIFPYECPYDWMKTALNLLGEPDQQTLSSGMYTGKYFKWYHDAESPGWVPSLMTPAEYQATTGEKVRLSAQFLEDFEDLDQAVLSHQKNADFVEWSDRKEFLSLLKCCLKFNPSERITPSQALRHNFLTMAHLAGKVGNSVYAEMALKLMSMAVQSDSAESADSIDHRDTEQTGADGSDNTPAAASAHGEENGDEADGDTHFDDDSLMERHSTTARCSGYSGDVEDHSCLTSYSSEDQEPASPHSSYRGPSTDISSNYSAEPSTATHITCTSAVDLDDGAARSSPPLDGASGATNTGSAEDVTAGLNGAQKKHVFNRLHRFLGRVGKRVRSIFQKMK